MGFLTVPVFALILCTTTAAPVPQRMLPVEGQVVLSSSTELVATFALPTLLSTSQPPPPAAATLSPPLIDVITATATFTEVDSTQYDTVVATQVVTATSTATLSTPPTPAPTGPPSAWSLGQSFDVDQLSSQLAVSKWEWGQSNVAVTSGIPLTAWATTSSTSSPLPSATSDAQLVASPVASMINQQVDLTNDTVMAVFYPNGSINPANKDAPIGGTGMYMTPLDLSTANNVSLEYSVFFPADFDFVKGGKLPGLYGGHTGCSGGQESEDCFSTRIMFRPEGLGELYLYVPKDSQPPALCQTPPVSYCDTTYGLSIGRGAWTFGRGAWTRIRQDIQLNTPGVADGGFNVYINDDLVLSSSAVMFRKALPTSSAAPASTESASSTLSPQLAPTATPPSVGGALGGLLGGLGGGLGGGVGPLGGILKRDDTVSTMSLSGVQIQSTISAASSALSTSTSTKVQWITVKPVRTVVATSTSTRTLTSVSTTTPTITSYSTPIIPAMSSQLDSVSGVKFLGIMFDTFFGGNSAEYASTKDQYTYFNRLGMFINS